MAVTYRTNTTATGSGTSLSVNPPSGLASGDLWIIIVTKDAGSGNIRLPPGWQSLGGQQGQGAGFITCHGMFKVAGAGESAVTIDMVTAGSSGNDALSVRVDGQRSPSPIDVIGTPIYTVASATTINAPDATVTNNGSLAILWCGGNSAEVITKPVGTTDIVQVQNGGGFVTSSVAYEARDAGAYAPGNWTYAAGTGSRVAMTAIIANPDPAPAAGPSATVFALVA